MTYRDEETKLIAKTEAQKSEGGMGNNPPEMNRAGESFHPESIPVNNMDFNKPVTPSPTANAVAQKFGYSPAVAENIIGYFKAHDVAWNAVVNSVPTRVSFNIPEDVNNYLIDKNNWNKADLDNWAKEIEGTQNAEPPSSKTRVEPSTDPNWKPDSGKENPYDDMPDWYAKKVADSYKPTSDRPLNPVQEAALKGQVSPKYLPEMVDVGVNQAPGITAPGPQKIPKVIFDQIEKDNPNFADTLKNQGIEAYKSQVSNEGKFIQAEYIAALKEFEENLKNAPLEVQRAYELGGIKGYNEAITKSKEDFEKWINSPEAPEELRQAYKEGGIAGYQKAQVIYLQKQQEFYDNNVVVGGKGILRTEWDKLDPKYQRIGLTQGFDVMVATINADNQRIQDTMGELDKYTDKKGNINLYLAVADNKAGKNNLNDDNLRLVFKAKDVEKVENAYEVSRRTNIPLPGEKPHWIVSGKEYTDEEFQNMVANYKAKESELKAIYDKAREADKSIWGMNDKTYEAYQNLVEFQRTNPQGVAGYRQSNADLKRLGIETASTLFFSPIRAALPEVEIKDISGVEWAVGGAQLATFALPFMPKGVMIPASGAIAGTMGYGLSQNWKQMDNTQRVLSIGGTALIAAPAMIGIAKGFIPISVKVPLANGVEVTVWKGISAGGKPIFGISEGKPTVGTLGVKYPALSEIKPGYEPGVPKIEASIMGTRKALKAMGMSDSEITKVEATLEARSQVANSRTKYMSKEAVLEGTERISPQEMNVLLKQAVKNDKVTEIYGSTTIKPQLRPDLRTWRELHDVDQMTSMDSEGVAAYTKETMTALEKLGGEFKIDPENPGTIMKKVNGEWVKITDIHSNEAVPGSEEAPEGAYGLRHEQPSIKVDFPGIGKLEFMRLSESARRKAASILQFQEGGEIAPAAHRTNDIKDFYVIIKTFKGDRLADEWARAYGFDPRELDRMAEINPPEFAGFKLSPSKARSYSRYPTASVSIPGFLSKGLPDSVLYQLNKSTAVPEYKVSKHSLPLTQSVIINGREVNLNEYLNANSLRGNRSDSLRGRYPFNSAQLPEETQSKAASESPSPRRSVKPSPSAEPFMYGPASTNASKSVNKSKSASLSAKISPSAVPSSGASPSPYNSASPYPSAKTSPSLSPSAKPSPSVSPSASPSPSLLPSPSPSPYINTSPSPSPGPKYGGGGKPTRINLPKHSSDKQKRDYIAQFPGAYTINMGELKGQGRIWWTYIPDVKEPVIVHGRPPRGARITAHGEQSGYKTAQITKPGEPIHEERRIGFQKLEFDSDKSPGGLDVDFTPLSHRKMPRISSRGFKRLPR